VSEWSCTQLDIIRHGEHELGGKICGVTDPVLSQTGWQQLSNQCRKLTDLGHHWDIVLTSPRKRCSEFAFEISKSMGIPCLERQDFAEVDFGEWEAMTFQEISERYPGQWQQWISHPEEPAPHGGENYGGFLERVQNSVNENIRTYHGQRILLFAHAGVMRAIYCSTLDLKPSSLSMFSVPYACHSRIKIYHHPDHEDWHQLDVHNSSGT